MRPSAQLLCVSLCLGLTGIAPGLPVATAHAQSAFSPVLYVNNDAVTAYEIEQRRRLVTFLSAPGIDDVENELIRDRLKIQAGRAIGLEATEEEIQQGMDEFAGRANMSAAQMITRLEANGIDGDTFRDFVRSGLVWRGVVRQRIVPTVQVDDMAVEQELRRVLETPRITSVSISELVIPAPPGLERAALDRAGQIVANVRAGDSFAAAARKYSATPSAPAGGAVPTMRIDNMPPALRNVIMSLSVGEVTSPLSVPGAVVLFYLRDTQGSLLPGAKSQMLDYLTLTLPDAAQAHGIAAGVTGCDDVYVAARGYSAQALQEHTLPQSQIPADVALRLAVMDPGEAQVIDRYGSAEIVALCDRTPLLLAQAENAVPTTALDDDGVEAATAPPDSPLPDREEARDAVFNAQIQKAADAFLAELKANAVIRRP